MPLYLHGWRKYPAQALLLCWVAEKTKKTIQSQTEFTNGKRICRCSLSLRANSVQGHDYYSDDYDAYRYTP